jgi:hypothetical protein
MPAQPQLLAFGDYLGIGAGAHGKLSSHEGIREARPKHPAAYLAAHHSGNFIAERRSLGAAELPFEFMMNALRLNQGFPATCSPNAPASPSKPPKPASRPASKASSKPTATPSAPPPGAGISSTSC